MIDEPRARATRTRVNLRKTCACGKDGTDRSHGPFTCDEVQEMRARHRAVEVPLRERLAELLRRWSRR